MRTRVLAAVALAALLAGGVTVGGATAQEERVTARVVDFRASYGPEGWKDESATLGGLGAPVPRLPLGYTGVYDNPYASPTMRHQGPTGPNYWGYALTADVEVVTEAGAAAAGDFEVRASIPLESGGVVPAKLTKLGPTSFRAEFDLDGEAGRSDVPHVPPGPHAILVEAYRLAVSDPGAEAEHVATAREAFEAVGALVDKPGFAFPENLLPGYSDLGPGNHSTFHASQVPPNATFAGAAAFVLGRDPLAGAAAQVVAVGGRESRVLWEGDTDAEGRAPFSFEPSVLLAGRDSGLLALEAHLTGARPARTVGSALLVLPVSAHASDVVGLAHSRGAVGSRNVSQADAVVVSVVDPDAGARRGVLHLVKGPGVLASADFRPESFLSGNERQARVSAAEVAQRDGLESYGLFAFLLREDGGFYSLATASRGLTVAAQRLATTPFDQAALRVTVRSFNDNFNGEADPGLEADVSVRVDGLPGGAVAWRNVTLEEGREVVLEFPLPAGRAAGEYDAVVTATMGELAATRKTLVSVRAEPTTLQKALAEVPAPGLLLVVAAFATAGAVLVPRARR